MRTTEGVGHRVAVAPSEPGRQGRHRRGPTRGGTAKAPVVMFFAVTEAGGVMHLVSEEAMAGGRSAGRYATVCGGEVLAASLTTPECGYCRSCRRWRAGR